MGLSDALWDWMYRIWYTCTRFVTVPDLVIWQIVMQHFVGKLYCGDNTLKKQTNKQKTVLMSALSQLKMNSESSVNCHKIDWYWHWCYYVLNFQQCEAFISCETKQVPILRYRPKYERWVRKRKLKMLHHWQWWAFTAGNQATPVQQ